MFSSLRLVVPELEDFQISMLTQYSRCISCSSMNFRVSSFGKP